MVSVPLVNGPSHVSAPEYSPASAPSPVLDAVPVTVALHAGVGRPLPPAAKNIVNVSFVPEIVPDTAPLLFR